jgi:ketosteroid isomerase-like protein
MSETNAEVSPQRAAALVREFYDSLSSGRMVDALNLVATDAVLRDEAGKESRGISAIARTLLPYREPNVISVEKVEEDGPDVQVLFQTRKKPRRYRSSISVDRGRIRSVRLERAV